MEDDPDTYVDEAREMEFEVILPGSVTQEETFARTGQPLVTRVVMGYNCCCFTYGQTGSGKTWTMFGSEADPGLVPRMATGVFAGLARTHGRAAPPRQSAVTVTYLQVLQERFIDLLEGKEGGPGGEDGAGPRVHLGAGGTVDLQGAVRQQVTSVAGLMVRATRCSTRSSASRASPPPPLACVQSLVADAHARLARDEGHRILTLWLNAEPRTRSRRAACPSSTSSTSPARSAPPPPAAPEPWGAQVLRAALLPPPRHGGPAMEAAPAR